MKDKRMNIIMHLLTSDLDINCDELIKEANILYNIIKDKEYINTCKN
jgi:hypothetical protein